MAAERHPMRDMNINVWSPMKEGLPFLASIGPTNMKFTGDTAEDARARAEAFRQDTLEKHESMYIAREKAKATRKAKKK